MSQSSNLFHLLRRCCTETTGNNLAAGRCIHGHVIKSGSWPDDLFLCNSVVNMYASYSRLPEASAAFEEMSRKDVVSWNSLINAYSRHGPSESSTVIRLFRRMRSSECFFPNAFTYAGVFTAAAAAASSSEGKQAHCLALKTGVSGDVFSGTSLLHLYSKLGLLSDARKVFDTLPERNLVTWAAMISGYAGDRSGLSAFGLFKRMMVECNPNNEFVITSVLSAVSLPDFFEMGRQVHGFAVKNGLVSFVSVENSLVTFYSKCEYLDDASLMFISSRDKNSVTWSAMVTGCAQNGDPGNALLLFSRMHSEGIRPNEFTFVGVLNSCSDQMSLSEGKQAHAYLVKLGLELQVYIKSALVDMYAKCGNVDDARKGFDQLNDVHQADIVLWTSMIGGYAKNGEQEEALVLYGKMQTETLPNNLTITTVLRACSSLAALEQGKQIHAHAVKFGFSLGIPLGSALSTMYAKCGSLQDCIRVFRRMPERDVVAWNSIISGFSQNGRGADAMNLYEEMKSEGIDPDHVTFVNLLVACSHAGLVDAGWGYFKSMRDDHKLVPRVEHHACMVDILSRAGLLEEAKDFVESVVPVDHGMCLWRIVLGACREYRNYDVGAYAGERLMELGSADSSAYILLSNIYAAWRRWEDVERVRRMMRLRGVSKEPGCSWVELHSRVHVFVSGEEKHPEIEDTYAEMRSLIEHMKDEGYRPAVVLPHRDHLEMDLSPPHDDMLASSGSE